MRYDTPIDFCKETAGEYDPETGNYGTSTITKDRFYADVNDTETEMLQLIYGRLTQGSYTIVILGHYREPFDYIEMDGKRFQVDYCRRFRLYHSFVVREIPTAKTILPPAEPTPEASS